MSQSKQSNGFWKRIRKPALAGTLLGAIILVALAFGSVWQDLGNSTPALVYYTVSQTDLPIVVSERGYLESQEQTTIRCQVESYDRNSGSSGTTILSIVPNGSVVKKGDLLVELDSAAIRDRLESETLEWQSDNSALLQAQARKENQETQNETSIAEADLALALAKLNRKMYVDEQSGSFKLSLEEIERQIDDTRNTILEAKAALSLQETEKAGIEQLFKLGYKGKSDLDQSRFAFMKAEAALAAAVNRLTNHDASRRQLETYQYQMELLKLDGEVATAERNRKQVQVTNQSELAQVEAQLFEAQERVSRQQASIEQLKRQLDYCTILAPHDGMVVYAKNSRDRRWGTTPVGEGAAVRERQELLTLPDLSKMQIRTQVHEATLNQVVPGLAVSVSVDAFPNNRYDGVVSEVAVVPATNSNSNIKTYDCVVKILGTVQSLKPGMTAVSEIHIERLKNVVAVPVQAVVQIDKETWCYVADGDGVKRCDVELGSNNDRFVELKSGLSPGSRVVLNPMAIIAEGRTDQNEIAPDKDMPEAPAISAEELAAVEDARPDRSSGAGRDNGRRRGGGREPGERAGGGRDGGGRAGGVREGGRRGRLPSEPGDSSSGP